MKKYKVSYLIQERCSSRYIFCDSTLEMPADEMPRIKKFKEELGKYFNINNYSIAISSFWQIPA